MLQLDEFAKFHGINSVADVADIFTRLGLSAEDQHYALVNPEHFTGLDNDGADKICGRSGWAIWFETSYCGTAVHNGDPEHYEGVGSLTELIDMIDGLEEL